MDLAYGSKYEAFRAEVRAFLAEHAASAPRGGDQTTAEARAWQQLLIAHGYAARTIPKAYGGFGAEPDILESRIIAEEFVAARAPMGMANQGISMLVPTLLEMGTEEQRRQWIPPTIRGEVIWCQGYSEPGSGSDLASLQLRATSDGDDYVLNGSKIWTTHAQWANRMFCLVRTKFEGKPQAGITFLLLEMDTPGIEVKPIITLAGEHEVNQVFFTDVRVPKSGRLGEENQGWTVAKYLLEFERGGGSAAGLQMSLKRLRALAQTEPADAGALIDDADFTAKLAAAEIAVQAIEMTEHRVMSELSSGKAPGPASSMLKTQGTEAMQRIDELAIEAAAYYANVDQPAAREAGSNVEPVGPDHSLIAMARYLNNRAGSIYGGSNEIQRDIMARLVLGL
jgi:acyl-CoA dehydrogenase